MPAEPFPAESPVPDDPRHPLHQLTTAELRTYRRELEHALKVLAEAPVSVQLAESLSLVLAEQESRTRIQEGNGK